MSPIGGSESQPRFGVFALIAIGAAVPIYSLLTYNTTGTVGVRRWLAIDLVIFQLAVVAFAAFDGWKPLETWRSLPRSGRVSLLLWAAVATASTALSSNPSLSAGLQAIWVVQILFAVALSAMLSARWSKYREAVLLALAAGLLIHSMGVYIVAYAILDPSSDRWQAFNFGIGNPRHYVFFGNTMLGIGIGFLCAARRKRAIALALLLILAAYHLYGWGGGRASLMVSIAVPVVLSVLFRQKARAILLGCGACAILAYPLTLASAPDHRLYGAKSIVSRLSADPDLTGDEAVTRYSSGRMDLWRLTLEKIAERPILGHGQIMNTEFTKEELGKFGNAMNPHNAVLQIAFNWGALGLLAFAIGLVPFLATLRARVATMPRAGLAAFAVLLGLAISSILDGVLFFTQPLFLIAGAFAVLASIPEQQELSSGNTSG